MLVLSWFEEQMRDDAGFQNVPLFVRGQLALVGMNSCSLFPRPGHYRNKAGKALELSCRLARPPRGRQGRTKINRRPDDRQNFHSLSPPGPDQRESFESVLVPVSEFS